MGVFRGREREREREREDGKRCAWQRVRASGGRGESEEERGERDGREGVTKSRGLPMVTVEKEGGFIFTSKECTGTGLEHNKTFDKHCCSSSCISKALLPFSSEARLSVKRRKCDVDLPKVLPESRGGDNVVVVVVVDVASGSLL